MSHTHPNTALALAELRERLRAGEINLAYANVEMIRIERFRLITGRVPRDIRALLNAAVKDGRLGHLPKDGHKPEAYFHPSFGYLAKTARNEAQAGAVRAIAQVMA